SWIAGRRPFGTRHSACDFFWATSPVAAFVLCRFRENSHGVIHMLKCIQRISVVSVLALTPCVLTYAQTPQPDNTKVNQRDRSAAEPTADQQKMNSSDQKLTAEIRKSIVGDKTLSTNAHNIK